MGEEGEFDYVGDGVYIQYLEDGGCWLLANSHDNPTDRIYLEPGMAQRIAGMIQTRIQNRGG